MKIDDIVFTDLDGTLLDHHTYSFEPALHMLNYIKVNRIPLIIVTSKTKYEVIELQKKLNIADPFIIENGAGIFIPQNNDHKLIALGTLYDQTREAFNIYANRINMRGFFDMGVEEIASLTDMTTDQAALAKQRTFSEPFILENKDDLPALKTMANNDNFDIVQGGRFYHLITKGQDKAAAIKKLIEIYRYDTNKKYHSIALGDGQNDITMLKSVDTPILIPKPDGSYIDCDIPNITKASFSGPKGWNETLKRYFNE